MKYYSGMSDHISKPYAARMPHTQVLPERAEAWQAREAQRPGRVLALAIAAVIAALALAEAARDATWELSGERYAHEVFRDAVQKARPPPAAN